MLDAEGIARGERALADGKVVSYKDAKERMSKSPPFQGEG
ncbi:toxin-antitoxin system subunit antitoxin [Vibrio ordalii FF-167]|nr:toxin-antitoxin system subunit antitoxin [Vibrio ordalii FF-167]